MQTAEVPVDRAKLTASNVKTHTVQDLPMIDERVSELHYNATSQASPSPKPSSEPRENSYEMGPSDPGATVTISFADEKSTNVPSELTTGNDYVTCVPEQPSGSSQEASYYSAKSTEYLNRTDARDLISQPQGTVEILTASSTTEGAIILGKNLKCCSFW